MQRLPLHGAMLLSLLACAAPRRDAEDPTAAFEIRAGEPVDPMPGEVRLRNVRQLTFEGENAEAYWSHDGTELIFQRRHPPEFPADQIFILDLATGERRLVSTGTGRTTCAYFLRGDRRVVFSSTHGESPEPPQAVRFIEGRYVWPMFGSYEIWSAEPDGDDLRRVTESPGYDAEATVCPVTGRIVFTSTRDGDIELYSMEPDGSDVKRLTDRAGYDGGAFYSHDGSKIVQRSGFLRSEDEARVFRELLADGYVMPTQIEITVIDRDGSNFRQVTDNGRANFAPFWHPDDRRIIFASNLDSDPGDRRGGNFELYLIAEDGTGLERVTHNPTFDSFPMFSPDGRHLVFASNRYAANEGDTNIFVAEWVEEP